MKWGTQTAGLVLVLLLGIPSSAAGTDGWALEASASRLEVGHGASFYADLRLVLLEHVWQTGAKSASDFKINGEELRLELDYAEPTVTSGGLASLRPSVNTTSQNFRDFIVQGIRNRGGYEFLTIPLAESSLAIQGSCGDVAAPTQDSVIRAPWVSPQEKRATIRTDLDNTIQWTNCARATLQISGDFLLCLWQWDFNVESPAGSNEFQTGRSQPQSLADAPDATAVATSDQQAFLFVKNGTLSIALERDVPHELYASEGARLHSESGARLVEVAGTLRVAGRDQEFQAQVAQLQGAIDLEVMDASRSDGLRLRADGLEAVDLDGVVVPLQSTAPGANPSQSLWILAIVALIGLVAWLAFQPQRMYWHLRRAEAGKLVNLPAATWRQRHAAALTVMGDNLCRGPRRAVLAWVAASFALLFHDYRQSHILRAKALHHLGFHRAAYRDHDVLDQRFQGNPRQRMMNAWMAHQASQHHQPMEAARWLAHARDCDPVAFAQLQHDSGLRLRGLS